MAGELVPRKITREQLERIIQRAAELQAGEMDTGEEMTEQELLKLGSEVGIPGRYLRQALYEEASGGAALERGLLNRWVGPKIVIARRVVPGNRAALEQAISQFMTDQEAMTPKRRLPDRTVWERQKGLFAEMRRGLSLEGRAYHLARAADVSVQLTSLEDGYCHAEMAADTSNLRGSALAGAGTVVSAGVLAAAALVVIPGLAPLAVLPFLAGIGIAVLVARKNFARTTRMQIALEQVLDGLERGEIRPRPRLGPPRASSFMRIAGEIKRSMEDMAQSFRQPPGGTPPPGAPSSNRTPGSS
jgi:hypothetical protein